VVEARALCELLQLQVGELGSVGEYFDLEWDHFVVLGVLTNLSQQEAVLAFVLEVDLAIADADAGECRPVEERPDDIVETHKRDVHLDVECLELLSEPLVFEQRVRVLVACDTVPEDYEDFRLAVVAGLLKV